MTDFNFTLTEKAANRIADIILSEKLSSNHFLRLSVDGGGCSGFQYGFKMDNQISEGDLTIENNGQKLVIDDISQPFLDQSSLEFESSLGGAMFKVKNPNASSSCGCGVSFDMK